MISDALLYYPGLGLALSACKEWQTLYYPVFIQIMCLSLLGRGSSTSRIPSSRWALL